MAGRVEGMVALITGAARGQGRSHAVRLAEEGADIVAVDALVDFDTMAYAMATRDDLDQTVKDVEAAGGRIVARTADVRDLDSLRAAVSAGVAEFGRIDILSANAGICSMQKWEDVTPQLWQDTLDVCLTGVWNSVVAVLPGMIEAGKGSIIATCSTSGLKGTAFFQPYVAAKFGVLGLIKSLANELAHHNIRANCVAPTGVYTPMGASLTGLPDLINETDPNLNGAFSNALDVPCVDPIDISNAVLYLASPEARYVTGTCLTVDAGCTNR